MAGTEEMVHNAQYTYTHGQRGQRGRSIRKQAKKERFHTLMSAYSTVYMSAARECECENGRGGDDGQAQRRGKNEDGRTDSRPTALADSGRLAADRRIKGPSDCCVAKRRKNMGIEEEQNESHQMSFFSFHVYFFVVCFSFVCYPFYFSSSPLTIINAQMQRA